MVFVFRLCFHVFVVFMNSSSPSAIIITFACAECTKCWFLGKNFQAKNLI